MVYCRPLVRLSVVQPLWQTTGRRQVQSTPWHELHSPSTWLSSEDDFFFRPDGTQTPSVSSGLLSHLQLVFSYLKHIKGSPFKGPPNGEHVDQLRVGSVHLKHPGLYLQGRKIVFVSSNVCLCIRRTKTVINKSKNI